MRVRVCKCPQLLKLYYDIIININLPAHVKRFVTVYSAQLLCQQVLLQSLLHGVYQLLPLLTPVVVSSFQVLLNICLKILC